MPPNNDSRPPIMRGKKRGKEGERRKNTDLPPQKEEFAPSKLEYALPIMTVWLRACIELEEKEVGEHRASQKWVHRAGGT